MTGNHGNLGINWCRVGQMTEMLLNGPVVFSGHLYLLLNPWYNVGGGQKGFPCEKKNLPFSCNSCLELKLGKAGSSPEFKVQKMLNKGSLIITPNILVLESKGEWILHQNRSHKDRLSFCYFCCVHPPLPNAIIFYSRAKSEFQTQSNWDFSYYIYEAGKKKQKSKESDAREEYFYVRMRVQRAFFCPAQKVKIFQLTWTNSDQFGTCVNFFFAVLASAYIGPTFYILSIESSTWVSPR